MKEAEDIKEAVEFIISTGYSHSLVKQACDELALEQTELLPKSLTEFINNNTPKDIAEVYCKHYEARRRAKLLIVAKFLIDNRLGKNKEKSDGMIRSLSLANTKKTNSFQTPKDDKDKNLFIIKRNLMKKLNVEKNLKKLKIEEENKRKSFEMKLNNKSCRSARSPQSEKKVGFARRERRIKEILMKKYKDIEEHERHALSAMTSIRRDDFKSHSNSFQYNGRKINEIEFVKDFEDKIDKQLEDINQRLSKSAERAKKVLLEKTSSSSLIKNKVKKVIIHKEELDNEQYQKNIERINKIKQEFNESNVLGI
jgi:hypothetical protein